MALVKSISSASEVDDEEDDPRTIDMSFSSVMFGLFFVFVMRRAVVFVVLLLLLAEVEGVSLEGGFLTARD